MPRGVAFVVLMILGIVLPTALAQPVHPDVTIRIYRVQEVDPIDFITLPSFYYYVGVRDSSYWKWRGHFPLPDGTDIQVDTNHTFTVTRAVVEIAIVLCEGDTLSADDAADLSGSFGRGPDDNGCPPPAAEAPSYAYLGVWDLTNESLSGDPVTEEFGYLRSSGEFDEGTTPDENDANVWFSVSDNYVTPAANAGPEKTGFVGDVLTFDGGGSNASSGSSIEAYAWDFDGDGTDDALGRVASWNWTTKGTHTVRLRVTDSIGGTSEDTTRVTIQNRAPVADFVFGPTNPTTQQDVAFADASTDADGTIASFHWNFDDGSTSASRDATHRFAKGRSYNVTLTVTDNDGATATVTKAVTVQNVAPIAAFTHAPAGEGLSIRFQDASKDVDGNVVSWRWNFGDGTTSTERNPVHLYSAAGPHNVTLEVSDEQGATATASLTVSVREQAPQAVNYWPAILAILAIIILLLAWLFARRRKGRDEETEPRTKEPDPR